MVHRLAAIVCALSLEALVFAAVGCSSSSSSSPSGSGTGSSGGSSGGSSSSGSDGVVHCLSVDKTGQDVVCEADLGFTNCNGSSLVSEVANCFPPNTKEAPGGCCVIKGSPEPPGYYCYYGKNAIPSTCAATWIAPVTESDLPY